MTALLKTKQWFKHPRLEQINTSVDACAILGVEKHVLFMSCFSNTAYKFTLKIDPHCKTLKNL